MIVQLALILHRRFRMRGLVLSEVLPVFAGLGDGFAQTFAPRSINVLPLRSR